MSTEQIDAALARAQAKFGPIAKAKQANAGKYGYSYADLADVLAEIRPKLADEGIAIVQSPRTTEHGMVLVTQLRHAGEVIESEMDLPIENAGPQEVGSILSYYRRYAACAIAGVQPENEDDDGQAAQQSVRHESKRERGSGRPSGSGGKPSEKQLGYAAKLLDEVVHHSLHAETLTAQTSKSTLEDLTTSECSALIDWLLEEKKAGRTPNGDITADAADGSEPF